MGGLQVHFPGGGLQARHPPADGSLLQAVHKTTGHAFLIVSLISEVSCGKISKTKMTNWERH